MAPAGGGVRCDALAIARACVEAQWPLLRARGVTAGIELPCGPLPWLRLDEARLRSVLEGALASMAKSIGHGDIGIALWCAHDAEAGACLHVELYAEEPAAALSFDIGIGSAEMGVPEATTLSGRALIAEHHPARRRIVEAQLARLGLACETCANGDAALAAFAKAPCAFVWLGQLPDLDHVTLACALRRLERQRGAEARARVVAIRGHGQEDAAPAGDDSGIDAVVDWPVSLETLRDGSLLPGADLDAATRALFLEESRRDVAIIRAAWVRGDWSAVARHAHRIKGGTVVFGEDDICALAERVELAARRTAPDAVEVAGRLAELEASLHAHGT